MRKLIIIHIQPHACLARGVMGLLAGECLFITHDYSPPTKNGSGEASHISSTRFL